MIYSTIIRFAPVTHPHFDAGRFCALEQLNFVIELWGETSLGRDLRYIGATKRLKPIQTLEDVSALISETFPGTIYLSTEKQWSGRSGLRWTIALRKTVAVTFVELVCGQSELSAIAANLPNDHDRVARSIPDASATGFLSAVELVVPERVEAALGRFPPIALADYFAADDLSDDAEHRIVAAIDRSPPPPASFEKRGQHWYINWLAGAATPEDAWRNRLAWMTKAAKA